jgi:hypothetical protein
MRTAGGRKGTETWAAFLTALRARRESVAADHDPSLAVFRPLLILPISAITSKMALGVPSWMSLDLEVAF